MEPPNGNVLTVKGDAAADTITFTVDATGATPVIAGQRNRDHARR